MVYGGFSLLVNSCLFIKAIQCQIIEENLQPFYTNDFAFPIKKSFYSSIACFHKSSNLVPISFYLNTFGNLIRNRTTKSPRFGRLYSLTNILNVSLLKDQTYHISQPIPQKIYVFFLRAKLMSLNLNEVS